MLYLVNMCSYIFSGSPCRFCTFENNFNKKIDQVVGVLYSYVCMHLKAMELKYIRQGLTDQHFISRFQALVD